MTGSVRVVSVLGSTGSIGTQAAEVVAARRDRFRVAAIAAGGRRPELLARQAAELDVEAVGVAEESAADAVRTALAERYGTSWTPAGTLTHVDALPVRGARVQLDVIVAG